MKVVSFNVNSVRQRLHQLQALVDAHQPDIIGLQETKVQDHEFPLSELQELGYEVICHGQKTHYGVALLTRLPVRSSQKGFPADDESVQKRFVAAHLELPDGRPLHVINGYFPQGETIDHPTKFPNKRWFYSELQRYLNESLVPTDNVLVMGDMNISPTDADIGIGEANRKRWLQTGKCSFQPQEREWLQTLQAWGLGDTFRRINPDADDAFSWFDYRSRGFEQEPKRGLRIDLILASQPMLERCIDASIDYPIRAMDKPSDHAPIWANFEL